MTDLPTASLLRATPAPSREVVSWSLWDFGSNAFNTVMWSFVFSVYVISPAVSPTPQIGATVWGASQAVSGLLLAALAPLMGAWADRVRDRRRMLSISTIIVVAAMAGCWFVSPDPSTLWYLMVGCSLLCLASVVQEIAQVFYNGMLLQIATPSNIGRISGTAWALGYFGGVLCLVVALFGFVQGGPLDTGLIGLPGHDKVNIRAIALFCAVFLLLASIPVMIWGPGPAHTTARTGTFSVVRAYQDLFARIRRMWRHERSLLHFLVASAVFRDGLAGVFAFAGAIAGASFGFSTAEVIIFGIAANVIAGVGTWILGRVDDWLGPHRVIVIALSIMIAAGFVIIAWHDTTVFWGAGLLIASMVGGIQSAARTLLGRITQPGEENENFGLYATVGRAVSFLAPALFALFTWWWGTNFGILGIVVPLALGLALFWPLRIDGVTHNRRQQT